MSARTLIFVLRALQNQLQIQILHKILIYFKKKNHQKRIIFHDFASLFGSAGVHLFCIHMLDAFLHRNHIRQMLDSFLHRDHISQMLDPFLHQNHIIQMLDSIVHQNHVK